MKQPQLKIGIMSEPEIRFRFNGEFSLQGTSQSFSGEQSASIQEGKLVLNGQPLNDPAVIFQPKVVTDSSFDLFDVTIGIQFHWERKENQKFKGALLLQKDQDKVLAINILPLEDYLISVISSEMSATSSIELLKAHAIVSRSWLIAQVVKGELIGQSTEKYQVIHETDNEYIRWYDREDHTHFDVCADDHCQRYQGITRQTSSFVERAVNETFGMVLMSGQHVCDARFSKSCGGISETFENVWEPVVHPYLQPVYDEKSPCSGYDLQLTNEDASQAWIRNSPPAFCNTKDPKVLSQVLNDYDQETVDFYRWKVEYSQSKLSELIARKTGINFGQILNLIPIERGHSGRILKLEIVGTLRRRIYGKELEIRKILSESHLYSSAFVVDRTNFDGLIPGMITLTGAGWGHGVGLCQIGAAMMGEKGFSHQEIVRHYFVGAELTRIYD